MVLNDINCCQPRESYWLTPLLFAKHPFWETVCLGFFFIFLSIYSFISSPRQWDTESVFAQNFEKMCAGHVISVICLFFINYLPHLVTSLCHCGVRLVQMCWAGFPSVPHVILSLPQVTLDGWRHILYHILCHILCKPQTTSFGSSLGPHIDLGGSLILLTVA